MSDIGRDRVSRRWIVVGAVLIIGLAALPLWPIPDLETPGWLAWVGRFHPLLVHFPLALVPLIVLWEGVRFLKKDSSRPAILLAAWIVAATSVVISVIAGYLLYASGEYGGELAREHLWGGALTAALMVAAALIYIASSERTSKRTNRMYAGLAAASLLGIVYTGHHGGMLTHGESFLSEAIPVRADVEMKPKEELLVFEDLILPALERRCVSCHNANKTKGELQLTSYELTMAGGESGAESIAPGDAPSSEIYHRITLPKNDDDFMPPEGKAPLSAVEKDLIAWWIEEGAQKDQTFGIGPADSMLSFEFDRYIASQMQARRQRALKREEIEEVVVSLSEDFESLQIEANETRERASLAVSMRIPPQSVDDNTVADLVAKDVDISSLSLVGSEISDDALYHIARLPALRSLYLSYNAIDGSGLVYLYDARYLERINLSHTEVTNETVLHLIRLPALEEVYLFDTEVDSSMVAALQAFMPEVKVSLEVGPLR